MYKFQVGNRENGSDLSRIASGLLDVVIENGLLFINLKAGWAFWVCVNPEIDSI